MESLVLMAALAEIESVKGRVVENVELPAPSRWEVVFRSSGRLVIDLSMTGGALYGSKIASPTGSSTDRRPGRAGAGRLTGPLAVLGERLSGARLSDVRGWGLNRVAFLMFEKKDRFGDGIVTTLVVELLGAWGNFIVIDGLLETGRILERLRPDQRQRSGRRVERGERYAFPPRNRTDLLLDGAERLEAALETPPVPVTREDWARRFSSVTEGTGSGSARDVVALTSDPLDAPALVRTWRSLVEEAGKATGVWVYDAEGTPDVRVTTYAPPGRVEASRVESVSAAYECPDPPIVSALDPSRSDLARRLQSRLSAAERLHARLGAELERRQDGAADRLKAETLLASAHLVSRGASRVLLPSPHKDGELEIDLDPLLTPAENARRFFREARKAETARQEMPKRIETAKAEVDRLRRLLSQLEDLPPGDSRGIAAVRAELEGASTGKRRARSGGAARPGGAAAAEPPAAPRDRTPASMQPRRYDLPGGWVILVGRSQAGNDYLTHRLAAPHDLWFHVHGASGSHVVLKAPDRKTQPEKSVLLAAAGLAALNSKARHASRVPVIYAEKRYVRKPRGSKPGLAAVTNEKSMMVKPAEPTGSGKSR